METAFVLIFLLLLLAGLIEFGWAYFHYIALQDAAGEGAAYGSMFSSWQQGDDNTKPYYNPDPNNIYYRVRYESGAGIIDFSTSDTTIKVEAPFITPGNPLTVTVSYTHTFITPIITPFIVGDSIQLQATAVNTILSPPPP